LVVTIGVLALQGDFAEHEAILHGLGVPAREVRLPRDLEGLDGLIIPGGESTTITRLLAMYDLLRPIRGFARIRPVWGTCAGMIVMAKKATDLDREGLELMDISVERNAFGRQVDSFETDLQIKGIEGPPVRAIFIRAPLIDSVEPGVEIMAALEDGRVVAAKQGHLMVTAFHPELTNDDRLHRYFIEMAKGASSVK
ncbi:MAG TPA: pyridoxal 5'-phosphate synthase glutaminase subunit PdxT, partial [Burkholderiales bacterium]|nr:pyridoxal 5'-phosphate synthase glutaminase subunit PdxT [Burkholderiales bacterium]